MVESSHVCLNSAEENASLEEIPLETREPSRRRHEADAMSSSHRRSRTDAAEVAVGSELEGQRPPPRRVRMSLTDSSTPQIHRMEEMNGEYPNAILRISVRTSV